jgi:multiple sugar transport system substrate-binding protein
MAITLPDVRLALIMRINKIHPFKVLIVLTLLLTACQGTETSTPPVVESTPGKTHTPSLTGTAGPKRLTATPTPPIVSENLINLSPEVLQGLDLSLWHVWPGTLGETLDTLVADFNNTNSYGIKVRATYQGNYDELYEKIDAAIQSGELPNLAVGYPYEILSWAKEGDIVADLKPYLKDADWGLNAQEMNDFNPVLWGQDITQDLHLGIPAQRYGLVLYYNSSWARELGFDDPPQNTQEFKEQACAAAQANRGDAEPDNDGTGGWFVDTSPSSVLSWLYAFGSPVVDRQDNGYRFNTSQTRQALAFLKDLHDRGCAWQTETGFGDEAFAQREALFVTGSIAGLPIQNDAMEENNNRDDWTVIAFPSPRTKPVMDVYGPDFAILRSTPEEQLAAWVFLRWFLSPEVQARWVAAGQTLPLNSQTIDLMETFMNEHPHWEANIKLLPYAKGEPALESWSAVRWVVSDVGTQMFRSYFTADRIPATIDLMDETAAELHERFQ